MHVLGTVLCGPARTTRIVKSAQLPQALPDYLLDLAELSRLILGEGVHGVLEPDNLSIQLKVASPGVENEVVWVCFPAQLPSQHESFQYGLQVDSTPVNTFSRVQTAIIVGGRG
jgi:hypothetical protein